MSKVFEDNVKEAGLKKNELLCKCGSIRYDVKVYEGDEPDGDYEHPWIMISCRKCGKILFYNGA